MFMGDPIYRQESQQRGILLLFPRGCVWVRESVKQYVHACFLQSDQIEAIGEYIEPRGATGVDLQKSIAFFFNF